MLTKSEARIELDRILHFWKEHMQDTVNGGFYGQIDGAGKLHTDAPKAVILNARILWTFSAAYQVTQDSADLSVASRAFDYFTHYFIDQEYGGVFWSLNADGSFLDPKKQTYAQAFAIYALAEYHKIASNSSALALAQSIFLLIEKHCYDQHRNGYTEALSRDWHKMDDVRLSDKDMNATKTMNTHLHVLEAYTNLFRVWPNEHLKAQLSNLIELMSTEFLDKSGHYKLFFDDNWQLLSNIQSFGHDIEGSWLLFEAAEVTHDDQLIASIQPIALKMLSASMEGLDEDGGLMNEKTGTHLDGDKHWWPQAEALVGLVNGWQLSGDPDYLMSANRVWEFTRSHIITQNQEWRWRVTRDQKPYLHDDICGPWKCPYHNGRAMIELINRLPQ